MRLSDLQNKHIINLNDGKNIGTIIDINLDDKGNLINIVVEKKRFFFSWFSNKNEIYVKWSEIEKIGEDVILVRVVY